MKTEFLLMAQYDGRAVIPLEYVIRDYFPHLDVRSFLRRQAAGDIDMPVVRLDTSQKTGKGVFLPDLAHYIEGRVLAAEIEHQRIRRDTER